MTWILQVLLLCTHQLMNSIHAHSRYMCSFHVASIFVPRPYLMLHPLWQLSSIMLHENLMRGHNDCPLLLTLKNILLCLECRLRVILTQRWTAVNVRNLLVNLVMWSQSAKVFSGVVRHSELNLVEYDSWIWLSVANRMQKLICIGM